MYVMFGTVSYFPPLTVQYVHCSFRLTSTYAAITSVSYFILTGDRCRPSSIIWFDCASFALDLLFAIVLMQRSYYARRVYIGEHYPPPLTGTPSYNLVFCQWAGVSSSRSSL